MPLHSAGSFGAMDPASHDLYMFLEKLQEQQKEVVKLIKERQRIVAEKNGTPIPSPPLARTASPPPLPLPPATSNLRPASPVGECVHDVTDSLLSHCGHVPHAVLGIVRPMQNGGLTIMSSVCHVAIAVVLSHINQLLMYISIDKCVHSQDATLSWPQVTSRAAMQFKCLQPVTCPVTYPLTFLVTYFMFTCVAPCPVTYLHDCYLCSKEVRPLRSKLLVSGKNNCDKQEEIADTTRPSEHLLPPPPNPHPLHSLSKLLSHCTARDSCYIHVILTMPSTYMYRSQMSSSFCKS